MPAARLHGVKQQPRQVCRKCGKALAIAATLCMGCSAVTPTLTARIAELGSHHPHYVLSEQVTDRPDPWHTPESEYLVPVEGIVAMGTAISVRISRPYPSDGS